MSVFLNDMGMISPLGKTKFESFENLLAGDRSGLVMSNEYSSHPVFVGEVTTVLPEIDQNYSVYRCKNNQLLLAALSQIQSTVDQMIEQYGSERIGIVIGTSTSGVKNTEEAIHSMEIGKGIPEKFHYKQQQLAAGADFLAHHLKILGPAFAVSTACSSSGRAFVSARRLIELGLCDAVIVGGADSLCRFTVHGFDALESVSKERCKPFGKTRDGINLSEASALFVMSKQEANIRLAGIGSSTDAYHFSAPDPEGKSVKLAMQKAMAQANIKPNEISYINLHGTATILNDAMESQSVYDVFGDLIPVSSTKGMTGHALGAAASLEIGFCWMLLSDMDKHGTLPANINEDEIDHALPSLNFVKQGQVSKQALKSCMSNSFAFGGNNVSVVLTR